MGIVRQTGYSTLDVHQATTSVAVLDSTGKLVMKSILETKAATILPAPAPLARAPRLLCPPESGVGVNFPVNIANPGMLLSGAKSTPTISQ